MNTCRSASLADSTPLAAMLSGAGSKDSACGQPMADPAPTHSPEDLSPSGPADNQAPIIGCGTRIGRQPSSTGCATHEPFAIRLSGSIGQEIVNQDGKIIAWTTDVWVAQVICKLLNDHEEMTLGNTKGIDDETICN